MSIFQFFRTAPEVQSAKFRSLVNRGYSGAIRRAIEREKTDGDDTVAVGNRKIRVVRIGEAPGIDRKK